MGGKHIGLWIAIGALASTLAVGAPRDLLQQGKALHDAHCLRCHDTTIYTRKDRKIHTPAELEAQVARCAAGPANVQWSQRQIDAVASYLRQDFYHF